jgi:nucleoside-diphosphate-sugar epimerase
VKVAVFGARGKVGTVMAEALAEAGHEVIGIDLGDPVTLDGCEAAVDFTQPDAVPGNVRVCVGGGGVRAVGGGGAARPRAASARAG